MHGQIMLCISDMSLSRTEFQAAYLLSIACVASLAPVSALTPGLLAAADQTGRLRSFEEAKPMDGRADYAVSVRTPSRNA